MFKDKVVLITGGNTGIGRATALEFAKKEAIVVFTYLEGGVNILSKMKEGMAIRADITKRKDIDRVVKKINERYGRVDILINNAGILKHSKLKALEIGHWRKTFEVNIFGMFNLTKEIIPLMKKGKVVNVASIRGIKGSHRDMDYSASKAAVINFTQSLAKELAPKINVNSVSPGITKTKLVRAYKKSVKRTVAHTLLRRAANPEEIAKAIVFLASEDASYITGENLIVDGGYCAN